MDPNVADRARLTPLEERTRDLLDEAYDELAPELEARFGKLAEMGDHELGVLAKLAESVGISMKAFHEHKLSPEGILVVWRPVARECVLPLFDVVADSATEDEASLSSMDWRDLAWKECESFLPSATALEKGDAFEALSLASEFLCHWKKLGRGVVVSIGESPYWIQAARNGIRFRTGEARAEGVFVEA